MEDQSVLDYIIYNDEFYNINEKGLFENKKPPSIYEVIRLIDGTPLYLEKHMVRLRKSAKLIGEDITNKDEEIINKIYKLMKKNKEYNINVKIVCTNFKDGNNDIYIYFTKSLYPTKDMYNEGIHTILYERERENPHAKISNKELRSNINKKRQKKDAFEALLFDSENEITEGSRSNVFFVKNNVLYTPPSEKVLLGVTRTRLVELCKKNNIKIIEKNILKTKLDKYNGAFITGTSIDVLPINTIEEIQLNSSKNHLIKKLMKIYENDKIEYIKNTKKNKEL